MKKIFLFVLFVSLEIIAQPIPSHYYKLWQKDSLYYLLTDKAVYKFYSHEASGEFYLTSYIEGNFNSSMTLALNDGHLFLVRNDTIDVYMNSDASNLVYQSTYVPGYDIYSIHGFGPYIFLRRGNIFNLFKIIDGNFVPLKDTLFYQPSQELVFFAYPYVTIAQSVYKYIEGFDIFPVGQINIGNGNTGITGDTLVAYVYYYSVVPPFPGIYHSTLKKTIIEEPSFSTYTFEGWGLNISQLHQSFGWGTLIAKRNLYYMMWVHVITTYNSQLAYLPSETDQVTITDNYIFLLGDSVKYSKWYEGSTFYPFTWTDITNLKNDVIQPPTYLINQNYPNPFNPSTTINYQIPSEKFVRLKVYDVLGNEVATLVNEEKHAGNYEVKFDASKLASGIYFYQLRASDPSTGSGQGFVETKKMILIK